MAKRSGSSFLIKNRLGVYYYQRRISPTYTETIAALPVFVRLSLHTKDKPLARKLARTIAVMWDLRAKQYFKSASDYHRGTELFRQYLAACSKFKTFEEISDNFLDLLDDETDHETNLLDNAAKLHASRQIDGGKDPYESQIAELKELINTKLTNTYQTIAITNGSLLSVAFEDFITSQRGAWKSNGGSEKTYREVYFPIFQAVVGNLPTNQLTKSHVNDFVKVILVFPSNKTKKTEYSYLSPRDFLNIDTPDEDRLSPVTQKKYLSNIGTFLRWLKSTDLTTIDLDAPLKAVKIQKVRAEDQKSVFTSDDLRKLFNSKHYVQGLHDTPSRFWVPLIALYTGARLNEICQLGINDVRKVSSNDRWVFDFNEQDDVPNKSLKRPHHARLVPIHKRLIDLGFLDYVSSLQNNHTRIFPELTYKRDENKYANDLQRWFNRTYMNSKNCNITTTKTSFHSFRHTVITQLSTVHDIDENKVAFGFGQTAKGGVYETRYSKHNAFEKYAKYFDLINFDNCFDVTKIRNWKHHIFTRLR
jgi:integrase